VIKGKGNVDLYSN